MKILYFSLLVLVVCIAFSSCFLFSKQDFYEIVDEMPRFPGCDDFQGNDKDKQQCSLNKMYDWLYAQAKYTRAENVDIDKHTFYSFIVDTEGNITEPTILIPNNSVYAQEGLRLLDEMAKMPTKWTPGKRKGTIVKVRMHISIDFQEQ